MKLRPMGSHIGDYWAPRAQRSLPASASHCDLVHLFTEVVKDLGRGVSPSHIGCSIVVAQNYSIIWLLWS